MKLHLPTRAFPGLKLLLAALAFLMLLPVQPAQAGGRLTPGHYISIPTEIGPLSGEARAKQLAVAPGVRGLQLRYQWRTIEPVKGHYNIKRIKDDLATLKGLNRRLIVMIEDRSFVQGVSYLPAYLDAYKVPFTSSQSTVAGGYSSMRWDPYVVSRFKALYQALAKALDGDPDFEGIAMQETAVGNTFIGGDYNYDPDAYIAALKEIVTYGKGQFYQSRFFWYFNFIKGKTTAYMMNKLEASFELAGVTFSGPDVTPSDPGHIKQVTPAYEDLVANHPRTSRECSFQRNSYRHHKDDGTLYTLNELFKVWSVGDYGCQYIFWNQKDDNKAGEFNTNDALKLIAANPRF